MVSHVGLCQSTVFSAELALVFVHDPATTEIYTLSLHDALPISGIPDSCQRVTFDAMLATLAAAPADTQRLGMHLALRSEEHTSELQSHVNLVCRLLLEKKKAGTNASLRGVEGVADTFCVTTTGS